MKALQIDSVGIDSGVATVRITGFEEGELEKLMQMPYGQMEQTVLEMLNERNHGVGTCWHNGYGVYGGWANVTGVYLKIGSSCD